MAELSTLGGVVKPTYEGENDTNAFTDAEKAQLAGLGAATVTSVNTQAGDVVLDADDIDDSLTTNKYTSATEITKLSGIADNATTDQSDLEIKTAYENNANTNVYTDTEVTKLASIADNATTDQTDLEIKTAYENNANTNVYTDTEVTKLAGIADNAAADQTITLTGAVTGSGTGSFSTVLPDASITYAKLQNTSGTDLLLGRSTAGAGIVEEITLTSAGRALIDDTNNSAQRTTLGLIIGTDVQAYDVELTALASLASSANKIPIFSGAGTATTIDLIDDDTMATATATNVASAESVKAYADSLSGTIVQSEYAETATMTTHPTAIPYDDSIPQNTEGELVLSQAITSTSATNKIRITVEIPFSLGVNARVTMALFQDALVDAIAARSDWVSSGDESTLSMTYEMVAGTTSEITFKAHIGGNSGTVTVNGLSGARRLGGASRATLIIEEIKV